MSPHPSRLAAAMLACLALVGASCGGSSGGDDAGDVRRTTPPTTAPTTGPVPAVDPGTIVVKPRVRAGADVVDGALTTPDDRARSFHTYVPSTLDPETDGAPVPLLIALHGGTGSGEQFERSSRFDGLAEANGFIVVYPDGVGADGVDLCTWNGGRCCGPAVKQDVDDVAFIGTLIDRLASEHTIDPNRVFATGHSNGGILAYRLACELSDRIAAIGVQSSAVEVSPCEPSTPVSVLHIHGADDQNLPIAGGQGPKAISGVDFSPPREGMETLATADGCPADPTRTTDPDNPDLAISSWAPCDDGTADAVCVVARSHPRRSR